MGFLFIFSISCLIAFMVLATRDGAYLHLWRYELFRHSESRFEHLTHTFRAIPFIVLGLIDVVLIFAPGKFWDNSLRVQIKCS